MTARADVQKILVKACSDTATSDSLMTEIDLIMMDLIGQDDTDASEMPKNWNPALKKQYINFRNHLRRSMRARW